MSATTDSINAELARLRVIAARFRQSLIKQYDDGDFGTEDLRDALIEHDLEPYGSANRAKVTVTFDVGWETDEHGFEASPGRSEFDQQILRMLEEIDGENGDFVVMDDYNYEVNIGPTRKGILPS